MMNFYYLLKAENKVKLLISAENVFPKEDSMLYGFRNPKKIIVNGVDEKSLDHFIQTGGSKSNIIDGKYNMIMRLFE